MQTYEILFAVAAAVTLIVWFWDRDGSGLL